MRVAPVTGYKRSESLLWDHQKTRRRTSNKRRQKDTIAMAVLLALFTAAILTVQTTTALPTGEDHGRSREAEMVLAGLTYTQNVLLSCSQPGLLPEVSGVNRTLCRETTREVNPTYQGLVAALDKVLRLQDLRERLALLSNDSVEAQALEVVVEAVVNQTCRWIDLLSIRFSSSDAVVSCQSSGQDPMSQIRKLHILLSTYQLVEAASTATGAVVGNTRTVNSRTWLRQSEARQVMTDLLSGTVYSALINPRGCTVCMS